MGGLEKYTVQVSTNSVGYYGSNRENPLIKLFCSGSRHCQKAAAKANSALRMVRNSFDTLTEDNFMILYTSYVRPHLDYCVQAVGPYLEQDLKTLEQVQRRATKLVRSIRHLSYQERLTRLKLSTMRDRFARGDLIETYKLLTGKLNVDYEQFFTLDTNVRTRGHGLKLKKRRSVLLSRSKFFSNRVVNKWNSLPDHVVEASTINAFKNRLDEYLQHETLN